MMTSPANSCDALLPVAVLFGPQIVLVWPMCWARLGQQNQPIAVLLLPNPNRDIDLSVASLPRPFYRRRRQKVTQTFSRPDNRARPPNHFGLPVSSSVCQP